MKRDWLQIFSNLAIIAGLMIVVFELNQSKDLAYGQILTDEMTRFNDRHLTLMSDDPREAVVKSVLNPETLSPQDAVTLDAYYQSIVWNWYSMLRVSEVAGIERSWRSNVADQARDHFSTQPGRRWLKAWAALPPLPDHPDDGGPTYSNVWAELPRVALHAIEQTTEDEEFGLKKRYRAILGK